MLVPVYGQSGRGNGPELTAQDRVEIQDLVTRYARALGSCAAEEYADLFAPGGGYFFSSIRGEVGTRERLIALVKSERQCNPTANANPNAAGRGAPGNAAPAARPSGPVATIESTPEGIKGIAMLGNAGGYEDTYVKTPNGWRFKARSVITPPEAAAKLTAQDFVELRRLAGNDRGQFDDVYVETPNGKRFRSSGVAFGLVPEGVKGTAYLRDDGGHYDDVYVKTAIGWRSNRALLHRHRLRNPSNDLLQTPRFPLENCAKCSKKVTLVRCSTTMKQAVFVVAMALWIASAGFTALSAKNPQTIGTSAVDSNAQYAAVVKQYCVTCHNDRLKTADLSLEKLDVANAAAAGETWEKVIRKLRRGAMPPEGARRPDKATYEGLTAFLETSLDRAAVSHPNPGRPLPHRLNRAEYANAIKDLLALDVGDVAALLPADDSAYGFDNIAEALGASSVLLERYVTAAGRISALAVGDPDVAPGSETFVLRQDYSQDQHVEGQPFGTVGGVLANFTFPLDAEYELSASLMRTNVDATRGVEDPRQVEFTVDGERMFLAAIGGSIVGLPGQDAATNRPKLSRSDAIDAQLKVRVKVKAGPRAVGVGFMQRSLGENTRKLQPFRSSLDSYDASGMPHIRTLSITGPFNATGPGDTPSRRRIFVCHPPDAAVDQPTPALGRSTGASVKAEESCAAEILTNWPGVRIGSRPPQRIRSVSSSSTAWAAGTAA